MKTYIMRINFFWDECDGGDDTQVFIMTVPDNETVEEIEKELENSHDNLCFEDEDEWYDKCGRVPDTLVEYICEKHGWKYKELEFDIDIGFQ